jgi:hypothetical protein
VLQGRRAAPPPAVGRGNPKWLGRSRLAGPSDSDPDVYRSRVFFPAFKSATSSYSRSSRTSLCAGTDRPRVNYALMLHVPTYHIYAFRHQMPGMALTGVSGPRNKDEWRRTPLEGVEYDEGELRAWAEGRLSEFDLTG